MVVLAERHQNIRIGGADSSCAAVGRIDAAVGQSDVVNNVGDFARRQLLPDRSLDETREPGSVCEAVAGGGAHGEIEGAAIDGGEEISSQPGNEQSQRTET